MTTGRRRDLGRAGEGLAAAHLRADGYRVLARNWRCRDGEIDIVARDGGALVFCEVKTRASARFGLPVEAVDRSKALRLRRLALRYLRERRDTLGGPRPDVLRFDVVSVAVGGPGGPAIHHLRGAF